MASLVIIALCLPLITMIPIQKTDGIELRLNYQYTQYTRQGSYQSTVNEVENAYVTYEISAAVDLDNLSLVLSDNEVRGFPVWANASSWSVGDSVRIGDQIVTITGDSERDGFGCWIAELPNGTDVYYSMGWGIFLGTFYYELNSTEVPNFVSETRRIELTFENLDDFYNVEYKFSMDAVLLSLIILEIAAIIQLIVVSGRADLLRKS
ncbi:MAG: hypothetical protein ACFFER_07975 [Candidatus Thorarchaeota archaeon]